MPPRQNVDLNAKQEALWAKLIETYSRTENYKLA